MYLLNLYNTLCIFVYPLCVCFSSFDCNLIWQLHNKSDNSINTSQKFNKKSNKRRVKFAELTNNQKKTCTKFIENIQKTKVKRNKATTMGRNAKCKHNNKIYLKALLISGRIQKQNKTELN